MATPGKIMEHQPGDPPHGNADPPTGEESLGEQLISEARKGHAEFVAGWSKFMEELGIQGIPMGAKKLREILLQAEINPDDKLFSQGIIAMREE